jgi:Adenylate cyclase regulatory domain
VLLGADRLVGGGSQYSVRQIAELSELGLDFQLASMRAAGRAIPPLDDAVLGPGDLELARIGKRYRELGLPDADSLEVIRMAARGLASVAETMRQIAMKLALRPGVSEDDLAIDFAQAAEGLMPLTGPFLGELMRLQLRTVAKTEVINTPSARPDACQGRATWRCALPTLSGSRGSARKSRSTNSARLLGAWSS